MVRSHHDLHTEWAGRIRCGHQPLVALLSIWTCSLCEAAVILYRIVNSSFPLHRRCAVLVHALEVFVNYHNLEGKKYRLLACKGKDTACRLIKEAKRAV